jgi:hypothetical protein
MKPQNVILTLLILLLLSGIFLCRKWREPIRREGVDRYPTLVVMAKDAACEMACLGLSQADVRQVLQTGVILLNNSQRFRRPCPLYTMQGAIANGKSLRIIFEQCRKETKVLTCYLLKNNFTCDCPPDRNK